MKTDFLETIILLIAITNSERIGDSNNSLGVQRELNNYLAGENTKIENLEIDYKNINDFENQIKKFSPKFTILVSAGEYGIDAFKNIRGNSDKNRKVFTIWSGHQMSEKLKENLQYLNVMALPEYALSEAEIKKFENHTNIIKTLGVPHNLTKSSLKEEFEKWQNEVKNLNSEEKHITIFLGGDAPMPDGTIRYFTKNEAMIIGNKIGKIAKEGGYKLIITNGPRTGEYNPETKERVNEHKKDEVTDQVSESLINSLEEIGVKYSFFDFKKGAPSAYKCLLYLNSLNDKNKIFVTGDSTSMISEITDLIPPKNVTIAIVGSMNETHLRHVETVYKAGKANIMIIDENAKDATINNCDVKNLKDENKLSDAEKVAKKASEIFSNIYLSKSSNYMK